MDDNAGPVMAAKEVKGASEPVPADVYLLAKQFSTADELCEAAPLTSKQARRLLSGEAFKLPHAEILHLRACLKNHSKYTFSQRIRRVMSQQRAPMQRFVNSVRLAARCVAENDWLFHPSGKWSIYQDGPIGLPFTRINNSLKDVVPTLSRIHFATPEYDEVLFGGTGFLEWREERLSRFRKKPREQWNTQKKRKEKT